MATHTGSTTYSTEGALQQPSKPSFFSEKTKSTFRGFVFGGLAACGAVTFTNPWEVIKTRLQLQGELVRAGALTAADRPYHNSFQGLSLIFRNEGIRGIQRGLGAAYVYQVCLNGTRLGTYEPIRNGLSDLFAVGHGNEAPVILRMASGGLCGAMGAALGSPLYLIKTRMQSYSPVVTMIGHQHKYKSSLSALTGIWKHEGIKGMYRGMDAAMARAAAGSSVQLPTYDATKALLKTRANIPEGFGLHFASSLICGFFVCCVMNPFDVVSTRMYNQGVDLKTGKGLLYKNPVDCFVKTMGTEGIRGLLKGFSAHYLRIGPHTVIMFVFLEQLKAAYARHFS
ncbi:hypothetical protein BZG36_04447 [Bifiguratus adelaidae]|uniref:Mitochondrial oxaloacetate transport protein n=1 Tax=Bifiguratus adelaidae TaxID=1938954 RepID=A0A261XVE4_9FUNG|nr:hypothetical protein BZG36_04447 [Bifiguratus adelaidae]